MPPQQESTERQPQPVQTAEAAKPVSEVQSFSTVAEAPKSQETPKPPVAEAKPPLFETPEAITNNLEAEYEEGKILQSDMEAVFRAKILKEEFLREQDPYRYVKRVSEQQKACLKKWFGIDLKL